jgi:hypothetical protein
LGGGNVTNKKGLASENMHPSEVVKINCSPFSRSFIQTFSDYRSSLYLTGTDFYLIYNWNSILNRNPLSGFAD